MAGPTFPAHIIQNWHETIPNGQMMQSCRIQQQKYYTTYTVLEACLHSLHLENLCIENIEYLAFYWTRV